MPLIVLSAGYVNAPWTCRVVYTGCMDRLADNYESYATEPALCMFLGTGCNDTFAMNFDPRASRWNMPELLWPLGYPIVLAVMAEITLVEVIDAACKSYAEEAEKRR